MKKIFAAALLFWLVNAIPTDRVAAAGDIEISTTGSEHTVAIPYEKSYRFVATVKNVGRTEHRVQYQNLAGPQQNPGPDNWTVLFPNGYFNLGPGEISEVAVTFEAPLVQPGETRAIKDEVVPIKFSWEGGEETITVTAKGVVLDFTQYRDSVSDVNFTVQDKSTGQEINNTFIQATLASGYESSMARNGTLSLPSGQHLQDIDTQYNIDQASAGYFLQISAPGYQNYFETNYLPPAGQSDKTVSLEPLNTVGAYTLADTLDTGFSIWWAKGSTDGKYLVFSQGTHGQPGLTPPTSTRVTFYDVEKKTNWQKEVGGECWGADISPTGDHVSVGCADGNIYLWNRAGEEIWKYENNADTNVRWVKFSPDGTKLLSGPVDDRAENVGVFAVNDGQLLWTADIGGYLREGRFSDDGQTVYAAGGNGALIAYNASTGQKKWQAGGSFYIPFILGTSDAADTIISAGKGRNFKALDLDTGALKWQVPVDQTVTAGEVATDGSVVGSTVGGMSYGISPDGQIIWARRYGGAGHNGVWYTRNGQFALFGGPNPTLFDARGNILWQREKDKEVSMSGVMEIDTGGANGTWMSEDGTLLVLGLDNGSVEIYRGVVSAGTNDYSQVIGPNQRIGQSNTVSPGDDNRDPFAPAPKSDAKPLVFAVVAGAVLIIGVALALAKRRRR